MNAFSTDILISKNGGKQSFIEAAEQSKVRLAKDILNRIANGMSTPLLPFDLREKQRLEEALSLIELRCLDLSDSWRRAANSKYGIEFREYCSLAFDIRRVLPLSASPEERLKNTLRLAAVGVLGDRSADIRRYLNEHEESWYSPDYPKTDWPRLVLHNVASAFLFTVRKKNWQDVNKVAESIKALRDQQIDYEQNYLKQDNSIRQIAAFELIAFYQLAKAMEMLGIYVGEGAPPTIIDDIGFHFSRAVKAADSAGIIELAILSRWLGMASILLVRSTND